MVRFSLPLWICLIILLAGCGAAESVIEYSALPESGDVSRGDALYHQGSGLTPACSSCHVPEAAGAPNLEGYADIAAERVEGQDAREYTFYAIAEPGQYIVEGYGNAMYNKYDENLTPQDIADLIAYVLTQ